MNRLTSERLQELLDRVAGVRVLVVGDLMLDVYLRGNASRVSPEAPVPVVHVSEEWQALGGAANVASNAVALGAACDLVGCVGRDFAGDALRQEATRLGIGAAGIISATDRPTTLKTRVLVRYQQVARYDREREGDIELAAAAEIASQLERLAPTADVIVLEDYNKGVLVTSVAAAALDLGRRLDLPVVVDPKATGFFGYAGATVFKPNLAELAAALRGPVFTEDPEWLERTRRHLDCANLLVTLGEHGMALVTAEGEYLRVPAFARSVYDVSGAGDTVTATLAVVLAAGGSIVEAALIANLASGVEVGKAGVATVSPDEIRAAYELHT